MGEGQTFLGGVVAEGREATSSWLAVGDSRDTVWADGSRLNSGKAGAAAVWWERGGWGG